MEINLDNDGFSNGIGDTLRDIFTRDPDKQAAKIEAQYADVDFQNSMSNYLNSIASKQDRGASGGLNNLMLIGGIAGIVVVIFIMKGRS